MNSNVHCGGFLVRHHSRASQAKPSEPIHYAKLTRDCVSSTSLPVSYSPDLLACWDSMSVHLGHRPNKRRLPTPTRRLAMQLSPHKCKLRVEFPSFLVRFQQAAEPTGRSADVSRDLARGQMLAPFLPLVPLPRPILAMTPRLRRLDDDKPMCAPTCAARCG